MDYEPNRRSTPDMTEILKGRRMRRNRRAEWSRRLVRETTLTVDDLIWPIFVTEGAGVREPVPSMPGVHRLSVDLVGEAAEEAAELAFRRSPFPLHLRGAAGRPGLRGDEPGEPGLPRHAGDRLGRAGRRLKTDVALDPYTSHGHDGLMVGDEIVNDATIAALVAQTPNQVNAGCHIVAPSDMMDGRIGAIRRALDEAGHREPPDHGLRRKYASAFYGPFRDAVGASSALKGDKRTYQMDPGNALEALREVELDIAEAADMVMVKPGLPSSRHRLAREGALRLPHLRLPGVRRVRDDRGCGGERHGSTGRR